MSLWKIAWRSIQQRALASTLTAISMALGVMLVVAVLVIQSVVHQSFHRGGEGYDLIVGPAKGSNLQLVLSSVYYLGQPIATIADSFGRITETVTAAESGRINTIATDPRRDAGDMVARIVWWDTEPKCALGC